jgi:hypothetical protein
MTVIHRQQEPFSMDLFREIGPLLKAHWATIAHYPDIPLAPDVRVYENAQRQGMLRIYTLRVTDDARPIPLRYALRGYYVCFVRPNPHYMHSLQAVQDILYLDPSLRKGWEAKRFIDWCDQQLASEGVQVVYQHSKAQHDFGILLERMGYDKVDIIYARRLDHGRDGSDRQRRRHDGRDGTRDQRGAESGASEPANRPTADADAGGGEAGDRRDAQGGADRRGSSRTERSRESTATPLGGGTGTRPQGRHRADVGPWARLLNALGRLTP